MNNKDKKTVLVTGGYGLVGRAVAEEVRKNSRLNEMLNFVFLSSSEADLTNREQTRTIFDTYKPSYVINLAARVGGLYANMLDNDNFYSMNMKMNENVLGCSYDLRVRKCLSCLSTCIFPDKIDYPLDESKIHLGPPHGSNYGYSMAKRQVDLLNRQYNELSKGISLFTAIIPTNVYGCYDNFSLEKSHVIPGLIHKAYLSSTAAKLNDETKAVLKVCGSGTPLRQFIYAPDLARLILWTLECYTYPDPVILSPDEAEEVSIGHISNLIAKGYSRKFDIDMRVEYDTEQSDGQYRKTASNRKFRQLYPEFTFTPLEKGIQDVIDWFCLNYPNVRQ